MQKRRDINQYQKLKKQFHGRRARRSEDGKRAGKTHSDWWNIKGFSEHCCIETQALEGTGNNECGIEVTVDDSQ